MPQLHSQRMQAVGFHSSARRSVTLRCRSGFHDGTDRPSEFHHATHCGYADPMKRTDTSGWPCTDRPQRRRARRPLEPAADPPGLPRHAPLRRLPSRARHRPQHPHPAPRPPRRRGPPHQGPSTSRTRPATSTGSPTRAATSTRSWRRWPPGANAGSPDPKGTPLVLHHTACDHDMHAVVVCSECDEPLDVRTVRAKSGPGYPKAAAAMTRDEWLEAFADSRGRRRADRGRHRALLELAGIAAHASERTAAPITCWIAAVAALAPADALRLGQSIRSVG